jgi:hypothetical protein
MRKKILNNVAAICFVVLCALISLWLKTSHQFFDYPAVEIKGTLFFYPKLIF